MRAPDRPLRPSRSGRDALVGAGTAFFRTPLRGRAEEAAAVRRAADLVDGGSSHALIVRGVAGVGKTRLLDEVLSVVEQRGWATVVAAPGPDSHLLPLGTLLDAARAADPPLLSEDEARALASEPDSRYWLAEALLDAIESTTAQRSLLVLVDDLQWADAASLAILRALATSAGGFPVLWVLGLRSGDHGPAIASTVEAFSRFGEQLDLGPLPGAAVRDMTADLLKASPDDRLARMLDRTENLPLLVAELIRGLMEEDRVAVRAGVASVTADVLPERFGSSIRERIAHLPDEAARVVQVAATLGRSFSLRNLADLLDVQTAALVEGVEQAVKAELLVDGARLRFRHDAVREAAEDMLTVPVRSHLRRRAADIRLRSGEPLLAVAASVADAAEQGDTEAVRMLVRAALQLADTDAIEASTLALRAVELSTSFEGGDALAPLVPVLWVGGRPDAAKDLARRLRTSLTPDGHARVQLGLARLETESSFADAIRTCDAALAGDGPSGEVRAQLLAVRSLALSNAGDHARLVESLAEARTAAEDAGSASALATVEATESVLRLYEHRFGDAAALIGSAVDRMADLPGVDAAQWLPERLWPAFLANSVGRNHDALRLADESIEVARGARNAIAIAFWSMVRCRVLLDLGELEEARAQAEAVLMTSEQLGLGDFAQATAGVVVYRVNLHVGDHAACRRQLGAVRRMATRPELHRAGAWLLALTADTEDDPGEVVARTADAYETLAVATPSMTTPADFWDDALLARLWLRAGATDRLPRLMEVTGARAAANPGNDLVAAIHHQVVGLATGDTSRLRSAVDLLRRCERPMLLASALEDLGTAEHGAGLDATTSWRAAADVYERCDAVRETARVLKRLRGIGVRRAPKAALNHRGALSPRERQVADRLAGGATTRQIASDLSISQSTVITHVRHIYEKWGISTRRALIDRARR